MVLSALTGMILTSPLMGEQLRRVTVESPFKVVAASRGDEVGITRLALDTAVYRELKQADRVILTDFALPDGRSVTLKLRPVEVFAEDARIVVGTLEGDVPISRPDVVLLHGRVLGSDSSVFLALSPHGSNGWVRFTDETFIIATAGPSSGEKGTVVYSPASLPPDRIQLAEWECSVDALADHGLNLPVAVPVAGADDLGAFRTSGDCQVAQLALETDWEFTGNLFAGDTEASSAYATSLIAAVSEIYLRDVNTALQISFLRLWSTSADPWNQGSTIDQLYEFQDYWNANMTDVERHVAHYLSGRPLGGGVAYLPGLCNGAYAYGLSANLGGYFPYPLQDNHSQNWDLMVVAHELGHNFGARHTHDITPPIDGCAFGDCSVTPNGTIMSYCHTCPGGMTNILLEFHERIRTEEILPYLSGVPCDLWVDCEGPVAPAVQAGGCRCLAVTPQPPGSTEEVALLITSPDHPCLNAYVGPDGALSTFPAYQTTETWGAVHVHGEGLVPGSAYDVRAMGTGGGLSQIGSDATWVWGDTNGDDNVNVTDILLIIYGFQGDFTNAPLETVDLMPCTPDGIIALNDVMAAIGAYQGKDYADTICPMPCGP